MLSAVDGGFSCPAISSDLTGEVLICIIIYLLHKRIDQSVDDPKKVIQICGDPKSPQLHVFAFMSHV